MSVHRKQVEFANRGKTKSRNMTIHMIRRFQERLGLVISLSDINDMREQVISGKAPLLSFSSKGNIYRVTCMTSDRKSTQDAVIVFDKHHKHIVTVFPKNSPYYKKESKRTHDDLPYMLYLLKSYSKYLYARHGEQSHPIYCEKCFSPKLYSDIDDMSIVCHKCDYRFDTSIFQDVDIPLTDIEEKNPVKEAITLTKDLHSMLLSTKQELPFELGNKTFNISAQDNLLFKVNGETYPRNSRIIIYTNGNAKVIDNETFEKEYNEL